MIYNIDRSYLWAAVARQFSLQTWNSLYLVRGFPNFNSPTKVPKYSRMPYSYAVHVSTDSIVWLCDHAHTLTFTPIYYISYNLNLLKLSYSYRERGPPGCSWSQVNAILSFKIGMLHFLPPLSPSIVINYLSNEK